MGWFGFGSSSSTSRSPMGHDYIPAHTGVQDEAPLPVAMAVAIDGNDFRTLPPPILPSYYDDGSRVRPAPSAPMAAPICIAAPPAAATTSTTTTTVEHLPPPPPPVILYLSRHPMALHPCPYCQRRSRTRVVTAPNFATWLSVAGLAVVFWPICWLPLLVDSMKLTHHYCNNCDANVGSLQPYADCCVTTRT